MNFQIPSVASYGCHLPSLLGHSIQCNIYSKNAVHILGIVVLYTILKMAGLMLLQNSKCPEQLVNFSLKHYPSIARTSPTSHHHDAQPLVSLAGS